MEVVDELFNLKVLQTFSDCFMWVEQKGYSANTCKYALILSAKAVYFFSLKPFQWLSSTFLLWLGFVQTASALKLYLFFFVYQPCLKGKQAINAPCQCFMKTWLTRTKYYSNWNESSIQYLTLWSGNLRLNSAVKRFSSRCLHTGHNKITCMLLLLETLCCQNMSICLDWHKRGKHIMCKINIFLITYFRIT